ncbi:MAG: hypothetical protein ACYC4J_13635, partial [Gemmatimonadaceae bacterium]
MVYLARDVQLDRDVAIKVRFAHPPRPARAPGNGAGGEPLAHRTLRLATVAAGTWLVVTFALLLGGVVHERQLSILFLIVPMLTTMLLGAMSNALDVQFIPRKLRDWWQTGVRDRLWTGRAGAGLAKRLGAPTQSRAVGAGAFRATEAVLGVAAGELFAALPEAYREQLA